MFFLQQLQYAQKFPEKEKSSSSDNEIEKRTSSILKKPSGNDAIDVLIMSLQSNFIKLIPQSHFIQYLINKIYFSQTYESYSNFCYNFTFAFNISICYQVSYTFSAMLWGSEIYFVVLSWIDTDEV